MSRRTTQVSAVVLRQQRQDYLLKCASNVATTEWAAQENTLHIPSQLCILSGSMTVVRAWAKENAKYSITTKDVNDTV